jgi:hypothetical protein
LVTQNINKNNDYSQKEGMVHTHQLHSRWLYSAVLAEMNLLSLPYTPICSNLNCDKQIRFRNVQRGIWLYKKTNYNHGLSMINSNMIYLMASQCVYKLEIL